MLGEDALTPDDSKWVALEEALPPAAGQSDAALDLQARGVLVLLLDAAPIDFSALANPGGCPNCGADARSPRSPYCSPDCRDEAAFVRQFRTALKDGRLLAADSQLALGQKLWRLLGGGLPYRLSLIPERAWAKVLTRGCEVCGAPATTIDNTGHG